ncbi:hypothetical protein PR048_028622 [Dryococelus australis]|uniref:Uncharacterized protein n=1 Tax=Dryococelus australis TaxID=614101 RepID=A0ABQ9GB32_9NEOP|nr:hypothetical protein PR048_028622 [Dryococelus australis]
MIALGYSTLYHDNRVVGNDSRPLTMSTVLRSWQQQEEQLVGMERQLDAQSEYRKDVVVSFDGSTTIEEFLSTLNQEIGCRDVAHSGFTLFSDDPIEKDLEHFIDLQAKDCCQTSLDCLYCSKTCAFQDALQTAKQKEDCRCQIIGVRWVTKISPGQLWSNGGCVGATVSKVAHRIHCCRRRDQHCLGLGLLRELFVGDGDVGECQSINCCFDSGSNC